MTTIDSEMGRVIDAHGRGYDHESAVAQFQDQLARANAERDRLRAALRALVGCPESGFDVFAGMTRQPDGERLCAHCGARHEPWSSATPRHLMGCPIVAGREVLAGNREPDAAGDEVPPREDEQ